MSINNQVRSLFSVNKTLYFVFLCIATLVILILKKSFIESEIAAFEILQEQGRMAVFNAISGLQYLSIPIIYSFKFVIIAFVLWVGCFMFGYKITFTTMVQVVMIAETWFLLPELIKIAWFMTVDTDPNLWDVRAFFPLSLMNLFDYTMVADNWHYPYKALNLFEIVYWFILVYGLHLAAKKRQEIAVAIVFTTYVPFFLTWLWFYAMVYK